MKLSYIRIFPPCSSWFYFVQRSNVYGSMEALSANLWTGNRRRRSPVTGQAVSTTGASALSSRSSIPGYWNSPAQTPIC